jgi:hypothetical protein
MRTTDKSVQQWPQERAKDALNKKEFIHTTPGSSISRRNVAGNTGVGVDVDKRSNSFNDIYGDDDDD